MRHKYYYLKFSELIAIAILTATISTILTELDSAQATLSLEQTIEKRLQRVREKIKTSKNAVTEKNKNILAQYWNNWYDWPNWGNWNNWHDWYNWY